MIQGNRADQAWNATCNVCSSCRRNTVLGRRRDGGHAVKVGFLVRFARLTRPGALEFMTFNLLGESAIVAQKQRMIITMFVFSGCEARESVYVELLEMYEQANKAGVGEN